MSSANLLIVCVVLGMLALSSPSTAAPRIGWEESFDNIDRWIAANTAPASGTPMVALEHENGTLKLVTPRGALDPRMQRPDWPEWPENPASGFTTLRVSYDVEIDLDEYRYLVVRIVEKGAFVLLSINDVPTKVCYSAGIHSQDLSTLGLTGKQKITLSLRTLNSSNWVTFDYIRLVSELTEEEKAGFINEGLTVRPENQQSLPYHGLEALNARTGRPIKRYPLGDEWLVYRDTGTGAEVWKMTGGPGDEYPVSFNADGSAFSLRGRGSSGFHIFDWTTRQFTHIEGGLGDARPRFSSTDPSVMIMARRHPLEQPSDNPAARRFGLHRLDFREGTETEIAAFETDVPWIVNELISSRHSNKMLWGFRETTHVVLIDPDHEDPDQRVTEIVLPTRLKGLGFGETDDEIHWYNCYTYERWRMDLRTGEVRNAPVVEAGGHSIGGPTHTIGPYADLMKILVRNAMDVQTEATLEDVRIFGNYRHPVHTDYGGITRNGRYAVTDGMRGDFAGQHLMIPLNDPGTFMRIVHHHTSRNDWDVNTYSWPSPDATKVAWVSDQFDIGDIYMAVTGRPAAPTNLKAESRDDGAVELTWNGPEGVRENGGYRVYRSERSGVDFTALNREPIRETIFIDQDRTDSAFYLVAVVEPSGLEGHFSNEAAVAATDAPRTLYIEAEQGEWAPPMREVLHGDARGSRYIRLHRATDTEPEEGVLRLKVDLPAGTYHLWLRGMAEAGSGAVRWTRHQSDWLLARTSVPPAFVPKEEEGTFRWILSAHALRVHQPETVELDLSTSQDGLAIDAIILTSDHPFHPDRQTLTTAPLPATDLEAFDVTSSSVKLRWQASPTLNIARYDIHVTDGDHAGELGNATIIGSTVDTAFEDWGLSPGSALTYHVIAIDTRGNAAPPARVDLTTASQPIQTTSVQVTDADVNPRIAIRTEDNISWAHLPESEQTDSAPARISFPISTEKDGPFLLWATYQPDYVPAGGLVLGIEIDGQPIGDWKLRAPYMPLWATLRPSDRRAPRTWTDKIVVGERDLFDLPRGEHTVTLILDPAKNAAGHAVSTLYLSNDQAWRPPGYDPRANFTKRR